MQYSQEHLKTMVYAKFGGQTECIMGNWKIENRGNSITGKLVIFICGPKDQKSRLAGGKPADYL